VHAWTISGSIQGNWLSLELGFGESSKGEIYTFILIPLHMFKKHSTRKFIIDKIKQHHTVAMPSKRYSGLWKQ
jgi:hypothetical protein